MQMTGTKMIHVPYKGIGQAVTDLIAGRVSVLFGPLDDRFPRCWSPESLKALAVTKHARSYTVVPEDSTVEEGGVPGYDATLAGMVCWRRPDTPKEIVDKDRERRSLKP